MYKAFIVIFLCLFSCSIQKLMACTYAYQYSLFPLGSSGAEIIFLEIELERYVNTPAAGQFVFSQDPLSKNSIETRWKGNLKIKSSPDAQNFELMRELAYIDIADADYNRAVQPYFEKAMRIAAENPFFEEAILEKTANCAYDRSCTMFELKLDSIKPALFCQLPNEIGRREVVFPEILIKKYEKITNLDLAEQQADQNASKNDFYRLWKPCSARYYSIGDRKLALYCLGWGQKRGYLGIKDNDWKLNNFPVDMYIEGNDVMMHGQRFDICKIL